MNDTKAVTILIAALGGEGGGVLADWLIHAANAHDFPVQSTSVPGVAQRTGATTYYVEIFPVARDTLNGREPVMSLTPNPGGVDVVAASELIEGGRVVQNGFASPQRTTLIASRHREYAQIEKSAMGDGRFDETNVLNAIDRLTRHAVLGDLKAIALANGTVINSVLFGAMAGAGVLPVSRAACEEAIRASGKAVESSLQGFEAGYALASQLESEAMTKRSNASNSAASIDPRVRALPLELQQITHAGLALTIDYQDARYGQAYLDRVETMLRAERDAGGSPAGYQATLETARYLALWMSYEDVIRVADLKTREDRLARVRRDVGARDGEPLMLTEYLKPGLDELCSVLPTRIAALVRKLCEAHKRRMNVGMHLRTTTISGFAVLCALRSLRRWRRHSSRYREEHVLMQRWLDAIRSSVFLSLALARELALCGNLVKGYGETNERGRRNLIAILDDVADPQHQALSVIERAARVRAAREAALDDPEGRKLSTVIGREPPPLQTKPVRFVRKSEIGKTA